DRGIDAGELASHVHQCAARIARIDRGIGLNEELVVGDADLCARQGRNDPVSNSLPTPKGLPIASTTSPTNSSSELAKSSVGNFSCTPLSCNTARSLRGSFRTISASNSRLSDSDTLTSSAPSMTWTLVTTRPEGSTMTPDPSERCICSGC